MSGMDDDNGGPAASKRRFDAAETAAIGSAGSADGAQKFTFDKTILMAEIRTVVQNEMQTVVVGSIGKAFDRLQTQVVAMFTDYDKTVQEKFDDQQRQVLALSQRLDAVHRSNTVLSECVAKVDVALATVESATPYRLVHTDAFDRETDPTIVRLRSAANVSLASMLAAVQATIDEMRIKKEDYEVVGEPIGKSFVL